MTNLYTFAVIFAVAVVWLAVSMYGVANFKWYRKRKGGRWEQWIRDYPMCDTKWYKVPPLKIGESVSTRDRPETICRGTPAVEEWPKPSVAPHTHKTVGGAIIDCYHETTSLLKSWQFWIGMTIGFPLEHALWEKVWPFYLITHWLGL